MGNSQSSIDKIESAVDKGLRIYKVFKEYQKEQGPIIDDVQDGPEDYHRLRALAGEEAQKRNQFYERSQAAYQAGDGAEAKELSVQGHKHDRAMKHYNQQAADLIFAEKNKGRSRYEIDLHGLFVKEAAEKVDEALKRCEREGQDHLVIIVGKGLHSPDHIAKLKPAITEMVQRYNVSCEPNRPNPGCLYVEFGKGTGDLSWLDRFTSKMDKVNDECMIM